MVALIGADPVAAATLLGAPGTTQLVSEIAVTAAPVLCAVEASGECAAAGFGHAGPPGGPADPIMRAAARRAAAAEAAAMHAAAMDGALVPAANTG